jgi:phosphatidylglycerophosphate synthase
VFNPACCVSNGNQRRILLMKKVKVKFAAKYRIRTLEPYLPSAVSSLRLVAVPFLILTIREGHVLFADTLFLLAIASDKADGYLARKLGVSSRLGATFDALIDFLFVGGVFLYFGLVNVYPIWVFILIVFMFAQFMLTSRPSEIVFDPIGKYYGSLLYGAIGLTLLFSEPFARNIIMISFVGVTIFTVVTRLVFLMRKEVHIHKNAALIT